MKKRFVIAICLFVVHHYAKTQSIPFKAVFYQYNTSLYNKVTNTYQQNINNKTSYCNINQSVWKIFKNTRTINDTTQEITVQFICQKGVLKNAALGIEYSLKNWSINNYVMLPSSVYNGNRYAWRRLRYSPKLHDIKDIGIDKPIIINDVPKLNDSSSISGIQERTGSMALPAIGFIHQTMAKSYFIVTPQQNKWGDYGLDIEETSNREQAFVRIKSPLVREQFAYTITNAHTPSWDKPATFTKGDTITISWRIYQSNKTSIKSFFNTYTNIRKQFVSDTALRNTLPYSFCMNVLEKKFNEQNFVPEHGYYAIGMRENYLQDWQIGWTGGMISTYPLLLAGDTTTQQRVIKNFDWLFSSGISPSGFYWDAGEKGTKWYGGDIRNQHTKNWHLIRKSGDAVLYIIKQFYAMQQKGIVLKPLWTEGNKKVCDAFVQLWNRNKQLGQFIDANTGEIIVGGSSSGAIVPAAMVLAAKFYQNPAYQTVAEEAAEYLYQNFTAKGITCGGPGDALQAFDSESSYALVESFTALYMATQQPKWLQYAEEAAQQFSTWVVSYNYQYSKQQAFASLGIKTTGSVYANIQNKHTAPGICTASGIALFNLYRFTQNIFYLQLLQDIAHNITQYLPHPLNPMANMPTGWVTERINMTDWEGPNTIGYILPMSTWAETSLMLTTTEIPGLYIDAKKGIVIAFDNVEAKIISENEQEIIVRIYNPTKADAVISIYEERNQLITLEKNHFLDIKKIDLKSCKKIELRFLK